MIFAYTLPLYRETMYRRIYIFISNICIWFLPRRFDFETFNNWHHIDQGMLYIHWAEGIKKILL